jgi:L-threonylcarbamoyladenylate synthase
VNPPDSAVAEAVAQAVAVLRGGGVVAAATESSFGLLSSARSSAALDGLFRTKPRDPERGIGVIVPHLAAWLELIEPPAPALTALARRFWPGPLTIVAPAATLLDRRLLVGGALAVRVPGPSPAAQIVAAFDGPLTATSANLTGEPPCVRAEEVRAVFSRVLESGDLHLHAADAPGGAPSTFVTWADGRVSVIRNGAVTTASLEAALGGERLAGQGASPSLT